jgi:hypothetical protein
MSDYDRPDSEQIEKFCDIICTGLLNFIPTGHALVVEYEGEKFDICNSDGELTYFQCAYDTPVGEIVECVLVEDDEEVESYDQISEMTRVLHGHVASFATETNQFQALLNKLAKN